jgi:hypothetical protein
VFQYPSLVLERSGGFNIFQQFVVKNTDHVTCLYHLIIELPLVQQLAPEYEEFDFDDEKDVKGIEILTSIAEAEEKYQQNHS